MESKLQVVQLALSWAAKVAEHLVFWAVEVWGNLNTVWAKLIFAVQIALKNLQILPIKWERQWKKGIFFLVQKILYNMQKYREEPISGVYTASQF
ncbi:DUF418 domain-containing protein [Sesbania bispinosa]|nr:DUF418 domain-containing protein [Sesbania bispinosa]